jgi:hypothetical protein
MSISVPNHINPIKLYLVSPFYIFSLPISYLSIVKSLEFFNYNNLIFISRNIFTHFLHDWICIQ